MPSDSEGEDSSSSDSGSRRATCRDPSYARPLVRTLSASAHTVAEDERERKRAKKEKKEKKEKKHKSKDKKEKKKNCLLYTSPSPRDGLLSRMPSSA